MKKYILTAAAMLFIFASCTDDIIEVEPTDSFEINDFFSSESDFRAALGGAFQQFQNYYDNQLLEIGDIPSDNVIVVQTGRRSNIGMFLWNYTPNAVTNALDEPYEAINIANLIIANIDVLNDGANKDNIRGQAMAVRALAHLDLARIYAQLPTQSAGANASMGIAYLKFEDGDTGDPFRQDERETVESNYNEMIEDLLAARDLVDPAATQVENSFTVEAINGLLSRVYLYMGQYANAIAAANLVTTTVSTRDNLLDVFRDASTDGILLKLGINQVLDGAVQPGVIWSQSSATNTVSEYAMAFDLFSSIAPDDIRGTAFVFTGTNQGLNYNAINKWLGETGQVNGVTDIPVIRVAEVLLNQAEAQFEMGDEAGALATLDELRNARYTSFTGGETGAALENAIQFERRLEMFTEFHRFFDLKRRNEPVNRPNFGDIADGTGTIAEQQILSAGDFRFQFPFPQSEVQVNPNFVQNPGYTDN